jgi:hypothetical protein
MAIIRAVAIVLLANLAAVPATAKTGSPLSAKVSTAAGVRFTSIRTSLLMTKCHPASAAVADGTWSEGEDAATPRLACDAPGSYRVFIEGVGSPQPDLWIETDGGFSVTLSPADVEAFRFGQEIEWRLADGVPFAAIAHVTIYAGGDEDHVFDARHVAGERILIKGLKGRESLDAMIDARGVKTAARTAVDLADRAWADRSRTAVWK